MIEHCHTISLSLYALSPLIQDLGATGCHEADLNRTVAADGDNFEVQFQYLHHIRAYNKTGQLEQLTAVEWHQNMIFQQTFCDIMSNKPR